MESNILLFCLFGISVALLSYILPRQWRLGYLMVVNAAFYLLCSWEMFGVMLGVILITYFGSKEIEKSEGRRKRWMLAITIIPSLLLLFLTKYLGILSEFFITMLSVIGVRDPSVNVVEAITILGLSYYVFKAVSCAIDVYYKRMTTIWGGYFLELSTYISFFSQIICGPISRFNTFKEGLDDIGYHEKNAVQGIKKIVLGIFMKAVIADRLSIYVTNIYDNYESAPGLALWMAAIFYAIQLYCDFAGYSYVAIGLTDMLGLKCEMNFNKPYFSRSIKEFWNRWHISLSTWLRDYVYFPLGGSRCSKTRKFINIMLTFLVSGIWHGAGLTFIVWGLLHGLFVHLSPKSINKAASCRVKLITTLLTFFIATFLWIFFRAGNMTIALTFIGRMFTDMQLNFTAIQQSILPFDNHNTCVSKFLVVSGFIFILGFKEWNDVYKKINTKAWMSDVWFIFMICSIFLFGKFGVGFIYGNF